MNSEILERVRGLCLSFPGVTERPSHGAPTFFINDKRTFTMFHDNHHGDGKLALWCAAEPGAQQALVTANPECYFVPAYVGHRGWVGVRLDRSLEWEEVAEVLTDAYRAVAPAKLLAQLEG